MDLLIISTGNVRKEAQAYLDASDEGDTREFTLLGGILDPHEDALYVGIANETDEMVSVDEKQELGTCYSITEDTSVALNETLRSASSTEDSSEKDTYTSESLPEHLKEIFDKSKEQMFACLLNKYQDVFARSSDDLGCTDKVKHTINTGAANPIRQPVRRQPYGKRDVEQQEVQKMLAKGIIEP